MRHVVTDGIDTQFGSWFTSYVLNRIRQIKFTQLVVTGYSVWYSIEHRQFLVANLTNTCLRLYKTLLKSSSSKKRKKKK